MKTKKQKPGARIELGPNRTYSVWVGDEGAPRFYAKRRAVAEGMMIILSNSVYEVAPDQNAVLKGLLEFWDNGTPVHPGAEIVEEVRAAIRKAKGGS